MTNDDVAAPRWRGQPGRLEVWYATATDVRTGAGLWLHHEVVAPPSGEAYAHGWMATFPRDAGPEVVRYGPAPAQPMTAAPDRFRGAADGVTWDLGWAGDDPPLWTFPPYAWRRELLPSAHVVSAPGVRLSGTVCHGETETTVDARGAVAHIYGHGNAQRWAWLHAELDDSSVLEVIVAVARRASMRWLPPLAFVRLRHGGRDWPGDPLAAAPLFRARIGLPTWTVRGIVGTRRLSVSVTQPRERCVRLDYTDPDGSPAVCTNSEVADATVRVESWRGRWRTDAEWSLTGTAHAEVGTRP